LRHWDTNAIRNVIRIKSLSQVDFHLKVESIESMKNIKAVIFDLDGVLIDSECFHWQGWADVLKQFKINLSKNNYYNYAGKSGKLIADELIKRYKLKIKRLSLLDKKEKLIIKWFKKRPIKLMAFAKNVIKFFIDKGIKIGVASGGPKNEITLKLKRTKLLQFFDIIISRDDVKNGKPFPDIYELTVKKLKLKPKECVALEDTEYGVISAKAAGLTCFAIPNEFSKKQNFSKADKIFSSLKDVIEEFEKEII